MAGQHPRIAPEMTARVRSLRKEMTWPEKLFWSRIKASQLIGLKFRKQHPVGPFIADFYCADLMLVVEIDGMSHTDLDADARRQKYMEEIGMTVFRFTNDDVLSDLDGVIDELVRHVQRLQTNHPPLTPP